MSKIRSAEVLSLDKSKQKELVKETKEIKKKLKDGTITVKEARRARKLNVEQSRGLVFISHLPHGFFEQELRNYYKQFGKVTNVRVCRSGNSGRSKGFGYVEFAQPEVAKIAADTMNNYLMFKKRITAEYVPYEKRPKGIFIGKSTTLEKYSKKARRDRQKQANLNMNETTHARRASLRISRLAKRLEKLGELGVDMSNSLDVMPVIERGGEEKRLENGGKIGRSPSGRSRSKSEAENGDGASKKPSPEVKKSRKSIGKVEKTGLLDRETVRKVARELIKKKGDSLVKVAGKPKRKSVKK
ncbi:unnamed protein product [Phyllotreta striolata]|uniref:RRM domain-containing protein n=1 Tax=Phyllotreta striolata TaxID=444603 RepID=A0A9N9TUX5_PHYSR|nr:unnamed protein product [Phyllotreta striolata]